MLTEAQKNSAEKRLGLCKSLGLPSKISTNSLIRAINSVCDTDEYIKIKEITQCIFNLT